MTLVGGEMDLGLVFLCSVLVHRAISPGFARFMRVSFGFWVEVLVSFEFDLSFGWGGSFEFNLGFGFMGHKSEKNQPPKLIQGGRLPGFLWFYEGLPGF